jgi:hypothetical protein
MKYNGIYKYQSPERFGPKRLDQKSAKSGTDERCRRRKPDLKLRKKGIRDELKKERKGIVTGYY